MKQMERKQSLLPSGRFWKELERQAKELPLSCVTPAVREGWGPGPSTVTLSKLRSTTQPKALPGSGTTNTHAAPSHQQGRFPGGPGQWPSFSSFPGAITATTTPHPPFPAPTGQPWLLIRGRRQMFKQKPRGAPWGARPAPTSFEPRWPHCLSQPVGSPLPLQRGRPRGLAREGRGRMPCGMHGSEEAAPGVLLSLVREASATRLRRRSGWARTGKPQIPENLRALRGAQRRKMPTTVQGVPRQPGRRRGM